MSTPDFSVRGEPTLPQLIDYFVEKLFDVDNLGKIEKVAGNAGARAEALASAALIKVATPILRTVVAPLATTMARVILDVINSGEPVYNELAKTATDTLLGDGVRRTSLPSDSGRRVIDKLTAGGGTTIEPGTDGAANYLTLMLNEQVEAWARGFIAELLSGIEIAGVSAGSIETFANLEGIVENALGGGRMIRRVLQPFMNATAILPATWHVNKQFSPELLSTAAAIEAHLSGQYSAEQLVEELARQGFSRARIDVLVNNARKRLSFADLVDQHFRGAIADADVITRAGELGYDAATAAELLALATARRRDRLKDPIVDAAIAAFVAGDIGETELRSLVEANAPTLSDAPLIVDAARVRKGLRRRRLSAADERRLAVKGIRSVIDYRRALERDDFDADAIAALELELRQELNAQAEAATLRAEAEAARQAERAQAAAEKAEREAALDARRALPALTEFRRAYVRGRIDRPTFAAAIVREKIAITPADLELLLADADEARAAQLGDEDAAAAAGARRADPTLSLGQLERAVLADVIGLADFDARLAQAGYDDDERRVLTALLRERLEDRADGQRRRRDAEQAAAARAISLSDFERAVRLGLRSRAEYVALLDELGTSEIARSLILDLLDAQLAQDEAARAARASRDPAAAAKGLSLAQRRRAVVAGVASREDYAAALVRAAWPSEDQLVELELLDLELAEAAAARARRDHVADEIGEAPLTLGQVERAVKLSLLPPDAMRDYLRERGYAEADVELLVSLAVASVPNVRAAQQAEPRVAGALSSVGISLVDLKRAVRRGLRTLDDYAGELAERGIAEDDVELLRQLLAEELAVDAGGLRAKVRKALEAREDAPPIDDLDGAVLAGELDVSEARDLLVSYGVARDAAIVYARLLAAGAVEE